MSPEIYRYF